MALSPSLDGGEGVGRLRADVPGALMVRALDAAVRREGREVMRSNRVNRTAVPSVKVLRSNGGCVSVV